MGTKNEVKQEDNLKKEYWGVFAKLFGIFFKMGAVTFGGGVAMAPILMREIVEKREWLSEDEMIEAFTMAQSIPGVVAVNAAGFAGYRVRGIMGAVVSALAVTMPAVIGIMALARLLELIPDHDMIAQALKGVKTASVALIACTVVKMGKNVLKNRRDIFWFAAAFILTAVFDVNAVILLLAYALLGLCSYIHYKRSTSDI